MRIALAHMRHARTGGTERHLNQLATHLAERGHSVTVICRSHADPPHPSVRFEVLRSFAPVGAWRMWAFARALERHVAAVPYDVVYGLGKTWSHDAIRLGGGCHATYLERAHASTRGAWQRMARGAALKNRLALAIEARALAPGSYRRVVVNSEMVLRDVVRRHGVAPERIRVIPNGVDLERFRPRPGDRTAAALREESGFAAEDVVFLFLGSGYGRKGLDRVLEVFPALLEKRPRARLLVVGRDSTPRRWSALVRSRGLGQHVRFLGPRSDTELCYAAADVYVLPTRYDPFANTTLEALACGLPVVTSAGNGAGELLAGGRAGTVLSAEAPNDAVLASMVQWTDPARRSEAGRAARTLAERYPVHLMAEQTEALLVEVAAEKAAESPGT